VKGKKTDWGFWREFNKKRRKQSLYPNALQVWEKEDRGGGQDNKRQSLHDIEIKGTKKPERGGEKRGEWGKEPQ